MTLIEPKPKHPDGPLSYKVDSKEYWAAVERDALAATPIGPKPSLSMIDPKAILWGIGILWGTMVCLLLWQGITGFGGTP